MESENVKKNKGDLNCFFKKPGNPQNVTNDVL